MAMIRVEPVGFAESGEVAPGVDEGDLNGVLGSIEIAKDPVRDRDEPIAGHGHQAGVRLLITLNRQFDECSIHVVGAPSCGPGGTLHPRWERDQSIGSKSVGGSIPSSLGDAESCASSEPTSAANARWSTGVIGSRSNGAGRRAPTRRARVIARSPKR